MAEVLPSGFRRLRGKVMSSVGRRVQWTFADQGLSSLSNLAVSVFIARAVGPREFGAFGLAFAAYLLALNVARALGTQLLVIRFSAKPAHEHRDASKGATGSVIIVALVLAVPIAIVGASIGEKTQAVFVALAVMLPGLLLQDAWRYVFFTAERPAAAAANDGVWVAAQMAGFIALQVADARTASDYVLVWGGAATLAAIIGAMQAGVVPGLAAGRRWLWGNRDTAPLLAVELLAIAGASQIAMFGVAAVSGLGTVGALRAGLVLLGPLNVIFLGALLVVLPEAVRLHKRAPERLAALSVAFAAAMATAAIAVGFVAFMIPTSLGHALLGSSWSVARPVIPPLTAQSVATAVFAGAVLPMRVLEAVRQSMFLRLLMLPLVVGGSIVGASLDGAFGAATGFAIATGIGAVLAVWQVRGVLTASRGSMRPSDEPAAPAP